MPRRQPRRCASPPGTCSTSASSTRSSRSRWEGLIAIMSARQPASSPSIQKHLVDLDSRDTETLLNERYEKFRKFGEIAGG